MIGPGHDHPHPRRGYSGARPDLLKLAGGAPARILDVGCGAGMTGRLVRKRFPAATVEGVEPDPALAEQARPEFHRLHAGSIDEPAVRDAIAAEPPFDLIVCADVLEHLVEPGTTLAFLSERLSPDGRILTSIPNIRHYSTFVSLGMFGTWPQRERGIHDRTHLRFFARRDILALGAGAGLELECEQRNLRLAESGAWTGPAAAVLDFWPFRPFLTFQYLHRWKRRAVP